MISFNWNQIWEVWKKVKQKWIFLGCQQTWTWIYTESFIRHRKKKTMFQSKFQKQSSTIFVPHFGWKINYSKSHQSVYENSAATFHNRRLQKWKIKHVGRTIEKHQISCESIKYVRWKLNWIVKDARLQQTQRTKIENVNQRKYLFDDESKMCKNKMHFSCKSFSIFLYFRSSIVLPFTRTNEKTVIRPKVKINLRNSSNLIDRSNA